MTHEKQRIALAEWAGYVELDYETQARILYGRQGSRGALVKIPDYLNDLNAVHLLEMKLPKPKLPQDYWNVGYGRFKTILSNITSEPYSATAAQRCEAILKTLNLWKP